MCRSKLMIKEILIPKEKQHNEFRTRQEAKILTYIQRCQLLHLIGQSQSVESQIYLFLALFFNKHQKAASKSLTMLMDCNMLYHLIYLLLQITCTWMTSLSSGIHRSCIESKIVKTMKTPMNKQSSSNLKQNGTNHKKKEPDANSAEICMLNTGEEVTTLN